MLLGKGGIQSVLDVPSVRNQAQKSNFSYPDPESLFVQSVLLLKITALLARGDLSRKEDMVVVVVLIQKRHTAGAVKGQLKDQYVKLSVTCGILIVLYVVNVLRPLVPRHLTFREGIKLFVNLALKKWLQLAKNVELN